jgi:Ca2+-binding RTX toxin-like protein
MEIYGSGGNDVIWGRSPNWNELYGGIGHDTLHGDHDGDNYFVDQFLRSESGNDTIFCGDDGNDSAYGGSGTDTIYGGDRENYLNGGSNSDQIWGGGGDDTIRGESGADTIYGEEGQDVIYGDAGNDVLWGDAHPASSGPNVIYGGDGRDTIWEGDGAGWAYGEGDFDMIHCNSDDVTVADGGPDNDSCETSGDPSNPDNWLGDCCSDSCRGGLINCEMLGT